MKLTAAILFAFTAFAQEMPPVRGTVVEYGTNAPISAAEVVLYEFVTVDNLYTRKPVATMVTDARGGFTLKPEHPGNYFVEAKKPTYLTGEEMDALGPITGVHLAETLLTITREPVHNIGFILIRPGGLTGRVVDEDDKPVPNFTLTAPLPGIPQSLANKAVTDRDGVFTFPTLVPVARVIRAGPDNEMPMSFIQNFKKEDIALIEQAVQTSYWPSGVTDPTLALPINVIPGATANAGTVRIRKAPYYRALVKYSGECAAGERWSLGLVEFGGFAGMSCSKEFLLGKLTPGPHTLALWKQGASPADISSWSLIPFTIDRENVELEFDLTRSTTVQGRIVGTADFGKLEFTLRPMWLLFSTPTSVARIDPTGAFTIPGVAWPRNQVFFRFAPPNIAIREIRYGGQLVPDGIITPAPGAPLEIVVDDQPASITGKTTGGAQVYLAKWPFVSVLWPFLTTRRAEASGAFQLPSLTAGEYRLIAVTGDDSLKLTDQQVLIRLLGAGQKVMIERGAQQSVEVKLSDPAR